MKTFKEYLIEYDADEAVNGKKDVSHHGDEELIQWVWNDEWLYNTARSAQSFEDLMAEIDDQFTYNNDQYNVLARAFRMGDFRDEEQEEEETNVSAERERDFEDKDWGKRFHKIKNQKRRTQSIQRQNRKQYGEKIPQMPLNKKIPSEEEEAKVPAKRDRQMAINNWIDDTDKPVPLSRMKSQENRFRKRLYGKNT